MKEVGAVRELNLKVGDVVCSKFYTDHVPENCEWTVIKTDGPVEIKNKSGYKNLLLSGTILRVVRRALEEPKRWRDMTDEEKGSILLASHEGRTLQVWTALLEGSWRWVDCSSVTDNLAYRVKPELEQPQEPKHFDQWYLSKQDGSYHFAFTEAYWEVEKVQLGNCKQFAYRFRRMK